MAWRRLNRCFYLKRARKISEICSRRQSNENTGVKPAQPTVMNTTKVIRYLLALKQ